MATIKEGTGTYALAAYDTSAQLKPYVFGRPLPGPHDVQLDILYCGMCHSDLHSCNGDWGTGSFPVTPGHEIAGVVTAVGSNVTKFAIGDKVAVGCFVYSCGTCTLCSKGLQNS
jgi:alcohol dehydrogenase (NADP+)